MENGIGMALNRKSRIAAVSFGALMTVLTLFLYLPKWGIYKKEGTLIREMSQQEARTTVDGELLWRSLPAGEDR
jgi:hypothetical protein